LRTKLIDEYEFIAFQDYYPPPPPTHTHTHTQTLHTLQLLPVLESVLFCIKSFLKSLLRLLFPSFRVTTVSNRRLNSEKAHGSEVRSFHLVQIMLLVPKLRPNLDIRIKQFTGDLIDSTRCTLWS
jgi:hypothetical protein